MIEVIVPPTEIISLENSLLNEHKTVAEKKCVENPYWLYTDKGDCFYERYQRGPFEVSIGPIGAFTNKEMAVIVQGTTESYLEEGTFNDFPTEDQEAVDKLVSVMMDDFDDQRLVVSIKDAISGTIIGGCMIVPGISQQTLNELSDNSGSILPTLSALSFSLNNYGDIRESEVVCYSRYYRVPSGKISPLIGESGVSKREYLGSFGREVLSAMVRTAKHWGKINNVDLQLGILDTHDPRIIRTLTQYYAGEIIDSQPNARESVRLPHPLGFHYDKKLGMRVIGFNFGKHLLAAQKTDEELGTKINPEY